MVLQGAQRTGSIAARMQPDPPSVFELPDGACELHAQDVPSSRRWDPAAPSHERFILGSRESAASGSENTNRIHDSASSRQGGNPAVLVQPRVLIVTNTGTRLVTGRNPMTDWYGRAKDARQNTCSARAILSSSGACWCSRAVCSASLAFHLISWVTRCAASGCHPFLSGAVQRRRGSRRDAKCVSRFSSFVAASCVPADTG